jgi:hypothetical protein
MSFERAIGDTEGEKIDKSKRKDGWEDEAESPGCGFTTSRFE